MEVGHIWLIVEGDYIHYPVHSVVEIQEFP